MRTTAPGKDKWLFNFVNYKCMGNVLFDTGAWKTEQKTNEEIPRRKETSGTVATNRALNAVTELMN